MKGATSCQFKPYIRPSEKEIEFCPYVTRLIPLQFGFRFDYIDKGAPDTEHKVFVRKLGSEDEFKIYTVPYGTAVVDGLSELCDYEFYVKTEDGKSSHQRLVRTGKEVPNAVVLDYLHPQDTAYDCSGRAICAPSIVRLPSGDLFASTAIFVDRNEFPALPCLSKTYRSKDEGETWEYVSDIMHSINGSLFVHDDKLYFLTLRCEYDDLVIMRSDDEGESWSTPVTLFYGESAHRWGWHTSSMHPVIIGDRLYKAMEYGHVEIRSTSKTGKECFMANKYYDLAHHLGVLSIDKDADLMCPENWTMSELYYPEDIDPYQCIEGNIVEGPNGVVNLFRTMKYELSLMMSVDTSDPEKAMYNPRRVTNFPLSAISKFEIKKDPVTGKFIAIANHWPHGRRVLVMAVSDDMEEWRIAYHIHGDPDKYDAFSYANFIFSNKDIYVLARSGYNGSASQHDTNMITFHKVSNYGQYL